MRDDSRQDEQIKHDPQIKPDPARKGQSELERSRGGDAGRATEPSDVRNANDDDQTDDQDIDTAGTDVDQTSDVDSDRVSAGKPRPGGGHNR